MSEVRAISKTQTAQFLKYAQEVFMKNSEQSFKTHAQKTDQKFGYSVLRQMRVLFFYPTPENFETVSLCRKM